MGKKFLIDTNVIIEYISGILPKGSAEVAYDAIENDFNISVINRIEILGHPAANDELSDFLGLAHQYELTPAVTEKTIELRKTYKIKLPDAIIAATALLNSLTLITRDTNDFRKINGLKVIAPYKHAE